MKMDVGIDIQDLTKFLETLTRTEGFKTKVFTANELANSKPEHLCGIFCAKEAAIKAGAIGVGEWQKIEVCTDSKGKPFFKSAADVDTDKLKLSISHTATTCVAVVITL